MKNLIENKIFDAERALYNLKDTEVKNSKSGTITVDSVGEIINEDSIMDVNGKVIIRN